MATVDLPSQALPASAMGLAVALGVGLLIGIERERRKGQGDDRRAAGMRSFIIAALTGALAQALPHAGLVAVGALLVGALAALGYWKSASRDPGLTTELALLTTYLIGAQCVAAPALGAACGAGLALLLAARERMHRFATQLLTGQELHDGLLLAALALIVLPLVPAEPLAWLGGMNPRPLMALVLLIMAMQAAGQMALRWLGPQRGVLVSGLAAGFVSSTACIASFGSRARAQPALTAVLAGGAALSATATWLQALAMCALLAPAASLALAPVALCGALGSAAAGLLLARSAPSQPAEADPANGGRSALRPREALLVALLLAAVALAVSAAQRQFGAAGLGWGVALAGLADAHAPVAALAALHAAGSVSSPQLVGGVLLAVGANTATRCVVAALAGGWRYLARVAAALGLGLGLALGAAATWATLGA